MDSTLFTRLEKAGGAGILPSTATFDERRLLAAHLAALKQQGHAVVADEVYEAGGGEFGDLRVIHYRTCTVCAVACRHGAKGVV